MSVLLLLLLLLFQAASPLLAWQWVKSRGWSKRIIFLVALPIPALCLARGIYLFASVERLSYGERASVAEEYKVTAAIIFLIAAVLLYLLGVGVAWIAGGAAPVRPNADTLQDVFE